MSPAPAPISKPLQGEARPTIDPKNRVTILAEWREIIGGNEIHVMPSPSGNCLKLLPPAEMDRLLAFVNSLPGEARLHAQRKIGYDSRCVRWDAQGRCVLPEEFCKRLNLSGEVVMIAITQCLEIWNVEQWRLHRNSTDPIGALHLSEYGL